MKKLVSYLLILVLLSSFIVPAKAKAKDSEPVRGNIEIEFSDKKEKHENVDVIIENECVYIDGEQLGYRFGYIVERDGDNLIIQNKTNDKLPVRLYKFTVGSDEVIGIVGLNRIDTYKSPEKIINVDERIWIPLDYLIKLLNGSCLIVDDTLVVSIPNKSIMDVFADVVKNGETYRFEWEKDFGYTDKDVKLIAQSSHLVNKFSGLLGGFKDIYRSLTINSSGFDKKYGQDMTLLMCTQSNDELNQIKKNTGRMRDALSPNGKLGGFLSKYSDKLDRELGYTMKTCDSIFEKLKDDNSYLDKYNEAYVVMEKAFDKQTIFSKTGGTILDMQRGLEDSTVLIDWLDKVGYLFEATQYMSEFGNQDKFAVDALKNSLEYEKINSNLPKETKKTILENIDLMKKDILSYSSYKMFENNIGDLMLDAFETKNLLGKNANLLLGAWSIASNYIPFIENGLSSADKFELSLYAYLLQSDSYVKFTDMRNEFFVSGDDIKPEDLYKVSELCYVYLKSCYITRSAALASLDGKRESVKNELEYLMQEQEAVNEKIAENLVLLKSANKDNKYYVYGFLPSDNEKYLNEYNSESLIKIIEEKEVEQIENYNWKDAYITYLEKLPDDIKNNKKFNLVFVDDNDIPELYYDRGLGYAGGDCLVYYGNKEAKEFNFSSEGNGVSYIERSGSVRDNPAQMGVISDYIYSFDKETFTKVASGTSCGEEGPQYDQNNNLIFDFHWNNQKVDESTYKRLLNEVYDTSKAKLFYEEGKMHSYSEIIEIIRNYGNESINETDAKINKSEYDMIYSFKADIEAQSDDINERLQQATAQNQMNRLSLELYNLWYDGLYSLWDKIKSVATEEQYKKLYADNSTWEKNLEDEMEKAGQEYEGGSIQPLIKNFCGVDIIETRFYYLIDWVDDNIK